MRTRVIALLVALAGPASARGDEPITVLPVVRVIGDPGLVAAVGLELDRLFELAPPGLELVHEPAIETEVRACGSDLACAGKLLARERIGAGLEVVVNADGRPETVSAQLFSPSGRPIEVGYAELEPGADRLALARQTVVRLFAAAERPFLAGLAVELSPAEAVVSVGAIEQRGPVAEFRLPGGPVELLASAPGRSPERREVELVSGERARVELRLTESPIVAEPWFWAVVGAAALLAAGGAVLAATIGPDPRYAICQTRGDPCP